ncbi:MAG: ectoine hydroxylase [Parasphingorhabdus sp.]|jgi:ectoine hydroxylase
MLTEQQFASYFEQGYIFLPELLPVDQISAVMSQVQRLCSLDRPEVIFENDGTTVRSLMNVHSFCAEANILARHPAIIEPAMRIIESDIYIFQCILNLKRAFSGDMWQWHQDYPTYLTDDGMPANRLLNVLIFMEEVNEFNGPLMMVPGSHHCDAFENDEDDITTSFPIRALDNERVAEQVALNGIVAPKGPPGSVILANSNIIHGSAPNMSPWNRSMISMTLNSVENKHRGSSRPDWVVMDDFTPVMPLG